MVAPEKSLPPSAGFFLREFAVVLVEDGLQEALRWQRFYGSFLYLNVFFVCCRLNTFRQNFAKVLTTIL